MTPKLLQVTYWRERQPLPRWADSVLRELEAPKRPPMFRRRRYTVSIDTVINDNAGIKQQATSGDPLAILRIRNPQGEDLLQTLRRLAVDRQVPERATRARRILRRLIWGNP